jgi:hemerythrin-like metal-binding protein
MPVKPPFRLVEWSDEKMSIGIDPIDKQHRYLVDTLWLANDKLARGDDDVLLAKIIEEMLGYAIMHFETEEELMQRYDYEAAHPENARDHVSQHREFSHRMVTFNDQLHEGQHVSRMEVLTFLNDWLQNHLLGVDQLFGEFLVQAMEASGRDPDD